MRGIDLKLRRIERGIKQWELASRIGVSPQRVSLVENGRKPVTTEFARRYMEALEELAKES